MTTPAGDGKTPHRARNLFDGIDLASNTMKVCLGSTTDYKHPLILRPLLGVKRTKSGAKQTLPLEGRLSGVSGRTPPWERPALWSDYFLGLVGLLVLRRALTFVPGFGPRPIFFASALRCLA